MHAIVLCGLIWVKINNSDMKTRHKFVVHFFHYKRIIASRDKSACAAIKSCGPRQNAGDKKKVSYKHSTSNLEHTAVYVHIMMDWF